jgi:hypothetical protein
MMTPMGFLFWPIMVIREARNGFSALLTECSGAELDDLIWNFPFKIKIFLAVDLVIKFYQVMIIIPLKALFFLCYQFAICSYENIEITTERGSLGGHPSKH